MNEWTKHVRHAGRESLRDSRINYCCNLTLINLNITYTSYRHDMLNERENCSPAGSSLGKFCQHINDEVFCSSQ